MLARLLTLGLVLMAWPMIGFSAENVITNAGFEDLQGTRAVGWLSWARDQSSLEVATNSDVKHNGRSALHIQHSGNRDWSCQTTAPIEVAAGDVFEIGGWIRCADDSRSLGFSVVVHGDAPKPIDWMFASIRTSGTHDWKHLHRMLIVPEGGRQLQFRVTGTGPCSAWIDDVYLRRVGDLQSLRDPNADVKNLAIRNNTMELTLSAETLTLAATDQRTGRAFRTLPVREMLAVQTRMSGNREAHLRVLHVVSGKPLDIRVELAKSEPAWTVTIASDADSLPEDVQFPGAMESRPGDWLVVPLNEGILYPVDEPNLELQERLVGYSGHGLSMPWLGGTDLTAGWMAVIHDPDDMYVRLAKTHEGRWTITPYWQPSLGDWRYARRITYRLFEKGGYVAMAKAYRQHMIEAGRFVAFERKRQANAKINRFLGAPDIWIAPTMDQVAIATDLRDAGVERGLICFHGSDRRGDRAEKVQAIQKLGYLVTRYDSYRTAWKRGEPKGAFREIDNFDRIAKRADGQPRAGWLIKTKRGNFPGYEVTSSEQLREARETIPTDTKAHGYDGRFLDTTTASSLMEDYDPKHTLTRSDDKRNKIGLFQLTTDELKLITGSETGQDWAAPHLHYFEGMMSLGPYRAPDAGRGIYAYKAPTPRLQKYQTGPYYRVPLWELVYHDSVVAYWYWGDNSDKQPELWDRRDLFNILYATPPLWMISRAKWPKYRDRWLQCYRDVCPIVKRVADREMLDHAFLTPDHTVQRTRFAGGLEITVNFGAEPAKLQTGETLAPMRWLVRE